MSNKLTQLKAVDGLSGIASLVGFQPKNLAYILYGIPDGRKYHQFEIPKAAGGRRLISAPIPKLMHVQERLAKALADCLQEILQSEGVKPGCQISHAFQNGLSIVTNAQNHVGRRWVYNLDLEDFFQSINFGRVRGIFLKNKHFQLNEKVATILAQISCHNNGLPQGAPTSPVISNIVAMNLDITLNRLARRNRCTYTRYADDLTFSTNKKAFPKEIAIAKDKGERIWTESDELRYRVVRSGFSINKKKSRMQLRWSRQETTGLTVNEKVNAPRAYIKYTRARSNYFIKGKTPFRKGSTQSGSPDEEISENHIQGMLSHILMVKRSEHKYKRIKDWNAAPSYLKTHRKFLDYLRFATQLQPTVICEGKTDNVYIRCALQALRAFFPSLIDPGASGSIKIDLFNYTRTTDLVQGLAGGTGDLKDLVYSYNARVAIFPIPKPKNPTIILVDNDRGSKAAKGVFGAVKNVSGSRSPVTGSHSFYHVTRNLYMVPTPLLKSSPDSMIEDFFESAVRKTVLKGKTFNPDEKTFDPTRHYGKFAFANYIRKNAGMIDFSGFNPILTALNASIADYHKSISGSP